jgi:ABC-type multidrug transport system fused ATPase/permease subunit
VSGSLLPVADRTAVRAYALHVADRHRRMLVTVVGLASLATVAGLAGPRLLGTIVQDVQHGTTGRHIDLLTGLLVLSICVQALLSRYSYLAGKNFGETVLAELRESFVGSVLDLPLSRIEQAGSGDLISRASRDVNALRQAAQQGIPAILGAGSSVLLTIGALVLVSPPLAAVTLITMPPILVTVRWYLRYARDGYLATNATYSTMLENLAATVEGAAAIETLRLGQQRIQLSDTDITRSWHAELRTLRLRVRLYPVTEASQLAPAGLMLLCGGYGYTRGWVSIAQVTAATLYVQQLATPVSTLLDWLDTIQTGAASLARLVGVAGIPADRTVTGVRPEEADRRLAADRVGFRYDGGREVLHDVDLTVTPGEHLAVVGPSGAGKSTLGRLLAGISAPGRGRVTVGGAPLIELPLGDLRGEVALVTQEHHVFASTLRENVALARPGASDEEILDALAAVDAAEWAAALPEGLGTRLGAGADGTELSAPQAQQLALARLVLADPRILVLDEATSLLDPRAARHLERSLSAVMRGRTVISIAHRLHTAHGADRVAVIEDGEVTELGAHHELIAADGAYARLWDSWHGEQAPQAAPRAGPVAPRAGTVRLSQPRVDRAQQPLDAKGWFIRMRPMIGTRILTIHGHRHPSRDSRRPFRRRGLECRAVRRGRRHP